MSWFLQNLKSAIAALCDRLQTTASQLFTNPTELSSGDVIIFGSSAIAVGAIVWWTRRALQGILKVKLRAEFTPGTVYVHGGPRVKVIPSLGPFVMKLETYLRMADIPYEVKPIIFDPGPKDKLPWIEYDGEAMGDSGLIIEFLNKEKGVDLNKNLSDRDRAVGRAFTKMLEENTYWGLIQERVIDDSGQLYVKLLELPWYIRLGLYVGSIKKRAKKKMWAHGIGRHSKEEQEGIIEKDLKALSTFLGNKPYLMGEEPTEADAAVFGQLSQFVWALRKPDCYLHRIVTKDYPNLQAYCVRMKELYWPDWEQLTENNKKDQ